MAHLEISCAFRNESTRAKSVGSVGQRQDITATVGL
jgi:hypothetical protein